MIGGRVIEVRREPEVARIWVMDPDNSDELAIWVEPVADLPEPGDTVWWHSRQALWTPRDRRFVDWIIPRIGYSFDPRKDPDKTYAETLIENITLDQQERRAQRYRRPA
jgi:hypothetical protein